MGQGMNMQLALLQWAPSLTMVYAHMGSTCLCIHERSAMSFRMACAQAIAGLLAFSRAIGVRCF